MSKTGKNISEVAIDLNKKSGLLGISRVSSDFRDVVNSAKEGNEKRLAIIFFIIRAAILLFFDFITIIKV